MGKFESVDFWEKNKNALDKGQQLRGPLPFRSLRGSLVDDDNDDGDNDDDDDDDKHDYEDQND